jgi:hypothetical protein
VAYAAYTIIDEVITVDMIIIVSVEVTDAAVVVVAVVVLADAVTMTVDVWGASFYRECATLSMSFYKGGILTAQTCIASRGVMRPGYSQINHIRLIIRI